MQDNLIEILQQIWYNYIKERLRKCGGVHIDEYQRFGTERIFSEGVTKV